MKLLCCCLFLILACGDVGAQHYQYIDSAKVMGIQKYNRQIKADPSIRLVEIKKYIPGISLDIRYATTNNFTHKRIYAQAKAFARLPVVMALKDIQAELNEKGLGLKIYDAYRPYAITVKFYQATPDTNFVADPRKGSKHNRGCAVDLSLIHIKTGRELAMPTAFDSFSKKAGANYANLPKLEMANRELLKNVMQAHGFKVIRNEWWHYDFDGWAKYPLLDIPFERID